MNVDAISSLLKARRKLVCLHSFVLGMETFENSVSLITGLLSSIRRRSVGAGSGSTISVELAHDLARELAALQDRYNRERAVLSEVGFAGTCILFMIGCAVLVFAAIYDASWATLPALLLVGAYALFHRAAERWASVKLKQNRDALERELVIIYPHLMVRNSGLH